MENWTELINCFLFALVSTEQVDAFFGWHAIVFMVTQHQVCILCYLYWNAFFLLHQFECFYSIICKRNE
jgi:hypothetical protein